MKAVVTLLMIVFVSLAAQAQDRAPERKVATVQMEVVQVKDIQIAVAKKESQVARLYRRSGTRVKKDLTFTTKNDLGIA